MSVSLVKISPATIVYVVGYAYGPYMPDPDSLHVAVTIDDARSAMADTMQRAADGLWEVEMVNAREDYASEADYAADMESAHEGSTALCAMAEIVKSDREGDVTASITRHGGWSHAGDDDYSYWIDASTLGDVFGDDTESDEYLDVVDALLSR